MTEHITARAQELVAALRIHADAGTLCGGCPYDGKVLDCSERLAADAAGLIEAQQAELALLTAERDAAIRRAWKAETDLKIITKEG